MARRFRPVQRLVENRADKYAETRAKIELEKLDILDLVDEIRSLRKSKERGKGLQIATEAREIPGRIKALKELVEDAGKQRVLLGRVTQDPTGEYKKAIDRAIESLDNDDELLEAYENLRDNPSLTVNLKDIPENIGAAATEPPSAIAPPPPSGISLGGLIVVGVLGYGIYKARR